MFVKVSRTLLYLSKSYVSPSNNQIIGWIDVRINPYYKLAELLKIKFIFGQSAVQMLHNQSVHPRLCYTMLSEKQNALMIIHE